MAWSAKGVFVTQGPKGSGIIDIRDGDSRATALPPFRGHVGDITDVAFSRDGTRLATTGDDGMLKVWDPRTGRLITSESGPGIVEDPSFSGDGSLAAAVWGERTIRIVDIATGGVTRTFRKLDEPGGYPVVDAALSADGRKIAVVDDDSGVVIMDVSTGSEVVKFLGPELVDALAWSPDDRSIATVGSSGVIEIWEASSGDLQHELWGQRSFVWAVAWSPDGTRIVTGGDEGAAQLWEVGESGGRELMSLPSPEMSSGIADVAFSPDGSRVMAGAVDRSAVKVWDVGPNGDAELANLPAPRAFGDAEFMSGGDHVAVTNGWGSVAIWGLDPLRELRTIGTPGPSRFPGSGYPELAVSPDGSSILIDSESIGVDGKIERRARITAYDTATGGELFSTEPQGALAPCGARTGPSSRWAPGRVR